MMRASHVFLRPEIRRSDAMSMIKWFDDNEVTRFLHEGQHTSKQIFDAVERSGLPIVTHLFNSEGSTYMICPHAGEPVGILRLEQRGTEAEIVVIIGNKKKWGLGIGGQAITSALREAFFECRVYSVIANIHPRNERSLRVFKSSGFVLELERDNRVMLRITRQDYLQGLYERNWA